MLAHVQVVGGQAIDVHLACGGQEPIECAGQGGHQHGAVGPQGGQVAARLAHGVIGEGPAGIGRPQRGDAQAGGQAGQGHAQQCGSRNPPVLRAAGAGQCEEHAARHGAGDDGHDGRQPHQAVGRRKPVGADDFGQAAHAGRAEEGGLGAHQREHAVHQVEVPPQDRGDAQHHQHHLGHLAADDHRAFAEAVGQVAGRGRQKDVGQHEADQSHRQGPVRVLGLQEGLADGHDQPAEHVVVEVDEELRGQQAEEARRGQSAAGIGRRGGCPGRGLGRPRRARDGKLRQGDGTGHGWQNPPLPEHGSFY